MKYPLLFKRLCQMEGSHMCTRTHIIIIINQSEKWEFPKIVALLICIFTEWLMSQAVVCMARGPLLFELHL